MALILPFRRKIPILGPKGSSFNLIFSFYTDAEAGDSIAWELLNASTTCRWTINGNVVVGNTVGGVGGDYGLNGTPALVTVECAEQASITAQRFTANHVTGNIDITNTTLDGLDLSDSDTLGNLTYTPSASFNYLDLNNANQSGSGLNTLFGSLDWDLANWFLDLRNNSIQYNNLALYLNTINDNCTSTSGTSTMHLDTGNGSIWWGMNEQATYDGMGLRNTLINSKGWSTISANTCDGIIVLTTNMGAADNVDIGSVHTSETRSVILDGVEFFSNKITDTGSNLGLTGSTVNVWIPVVETDLTFVDAYDQKIQSFSLHPLDNNLLLRDGTIIDLGANPDLDDLTISKWIHDQDWRDVTRFQDIIVNLNLTKDGNTVSAGVDRYWDIRWRVFTQDTSIEAVTLPTLPSGVVQGDIELFIDIQNPDYRIVESGDTNSVVGILCPVSRMLHFAIDDGSSSDRQPFRLDGGGDPQIDTSNGATKAVYLGNANKDIEIGSFSAIHCSQEQFPHTVFSADQRLTSSGGISRDRFNWGESSNTKLVVFDSVETNLDNWVASEDGFNDSGGNAFTNNDIWGITYDSTTGICKIFTLFRGGPNDYRYVITFDEVGASRTFDFNNIVASYYSDDSFTAQSFIFNKALSESQMRELFETIESNRAIPNYAAPPTFTIFTFAATQTEAALSFPGLATGGAGTAMWLMPSGNQYQSTTAPDDETTGADVGFLDSSGNQNVSLMYSSATWDGTEIDMGDGIIDAYFDLTNVEFDTDNLIIRLDANNLTSEEVAHFLVYIDTNSTAGNVGRMVYLGGSNGPIYAGMTPYDGSAAKTSLEAKGYTVFVNEAEAVLSVTLNLGASDAVDLSAIMLNSDTLTWVLPNGAVSGNSISASAGSTYGFDGTAQQVEIIVGTVANLSRLNVYNQQMSDFTLVDNDNYPSGCIIDFGGNVATLGDNKAAFNFIDQMMDLNQGANFTGEINFRSADYDTIATGSGKIYNTRAWTLYMDGTEETQTYPAFPAGTTSANVVLHITFGEPLLFDASDTDSVTGLIEHEQRVLSANAGGYSVYWDDSGRVTTGGYRIRDSDNNSNDYYFWLPSGLSLSEGSVFFIWGPGASFKGLKFNDGGTEVGYIQQISGFGSVNVNPNGGSAITQGGFDQNDAVHGFTWDFPNDEFRVYANDNTWQDAGISGYSGATFNFDSIYLTVNNDLRYDMIIVDKKLSDVDFETLYNNIIARY